MAATAVVVAPPPSLAAIHCSFVPSQQAVAHLKPSSHRLFNSRRWVKSSSEIEHHFSGDDVTASCSFEPFSGFNASSSHGLRMRRVFRCNCASHNENNRDTTTSNKEDAVAQDDSPSGGVAIAIKILQLYKREISPLLPGSCRFVPTCSEYGMQAFKKYGVVKGTILTAWRLSRCNPLGGSGFDPPRWFDEPRPPPY